MVATVNYIVKKSVSACVIVKSLSLGDRQEKHRFLYYIIQTLKKKKLYRLPKSPNNKKQNKTKKALYLRNVLWFKKNTLLLSLVIEIWSHMNAFFFRTQLNFAEIYCFYVYFRNKPLKTNRYFVAYWAVSSLNIPFKAKRVFSPAHTDVVVAERKKKSTKLHTNICQLTLPELKQSLHHNS